MANEFVVKNGLISPNVQLQGSTSGSVTIAAPAVAGTTSITLPSTAGTLVTTGDTGTVTNTMLAGSIANAKLVNSAVTVGSTSISLGASSTTLAGLTSVTSTSFVGALTGNASTATTLQTARTISLSGDVAGSVSFDGSANATISATIQPDSVALGTDTTGNYMVNVSAGTGVTVSHTPAEGSTATVSIGQAVGTTDNVTFNNVTVNGTLTSDDITSASISVAGNATITGNLTVSGTTTTINSTTIAIADLNLELARNATTATQANGAGITVTGPATAATLTYSSTDDRWNFNKNLNISRVYGTATNVSNSHTAGSYLTGGTFDGSAAVTWAVDATPANTFSKVVARDASGNFSASTITAALSGNASTASSWQNARTLSYTGDVTGSLSVDGSVNVSTALTLAASGVTAGTYNNVTVNSKGLVTSGSNVAYLTALTDTLATVTGRGASTSTASTFSGGLTASAGLTVSGSNSPSTPIIAISPTGSGAFQRGVRMLNSGMVAGDSLMYAVGQADNSRNMGQFYFYYAGAGSTSNRLSMGLHSVDDVFNIFGSGNIMIGTTTDSGHKLNISGTLNATGTITQNGTAVSLNGHTHSYLSAESDTLATVTARGASTSTASTFSGGLTSSGSTTLSGGTTLGTRTNTSTFGGNTIGLTGSFLTEVRASSAAPSLTFHYENVATRHIQLKSDGAINFVSPSSENNGVAIVQINGNTVYHSGNLTNLNQLTNGPGYITGESDTLATVTARGASTSTSVTLSSNGNHYSGHLYYDAYDAAGNYYPHFLSGSDGTGGKINWRVGSGSGTYIAHYWDKNDTQFVNNLKAPIFYDYNDTAYYIDPNATPLSIKVAGNIELTARSASWAEGIRINVPSSSTWGGIRWTRGSSTGNWALGYTALDSSDDISFYSGTTTSIRVRMDHSANLWAYGSMRSPIFYDSDNTGYYTDPASTSNLNALTTNGQTILGGQLYVSATNPNTLNSGWGNAADGSDIWINYRGYNDGQSYYRNFNIGNGRGTAIFWADGSTGNIGIGAGQNAGARLHVRRGTPSGVQAINGNATVLLDNTGDNFIQFRNSADNGTYSGLLFSDNNQGGYVVFGNAGAGDLLRLGGYSNISFDVGTDDSTSSVAIKTQRGYIDSSANLFAFGSMRSPIFYDYNDTGYYADPNGTSNLNGLTLGGRNMRSFEHNSFIEFYVGGDANTYYPVRFDVSAWMHWGRWSISRGYADTAPWDPIGTGSHKGGLTLTWEWSGDGAWGGNDHNVRIVEFTEQYTTMVAGLQLSVNGMIAWLRGGNAYYRFHGPGGMTNGATPYYSTYTASNGATYSPRAYSSNTVSGDISARYPVRANGSLYDGDRWVLHENEWQNDKYFGSDGLIYANQSRPYITYDRNDTGYYVDPNSTSNLYQSNFTNTSDHAIRVGTIRGTTVGSQSGDYIMMYERVHIGYPSGWGGKGAPSYGLSTYGQIHWNYNTSEYGVLSTDSGWGGTSNYPTLGSAGQGRSLIMLHNPHIPYRTDNVRSGASGRAGIRCAIDAAASNWWDIGLTGDAFEIYRGASSTQQFWIDTSGNNYARSSFRAPIFYDSDDTTYYLDPNNTGTSLFVAGVGRFGSYASMESASGGTGIFRGYQNNNHFIAVRGAVSGSNSSPSISGSHQTTFVEHMSPADSSTGWFFKDSYNGAAYTYNTVCRISASDSWVKNYLTGESSLRAPIFYDSNDTGYYADPNSSSRLKHINVGNQGSLAGTTYAASLYHDTRYLMALRYSGGGSTYPWLVHDSSSFIIHFDSVGDRFSLDSSGNSQSTGSSRAPIFYDSNDTAYYTDPNGTSRIGGIQISPADSGTTGNSIRFYGNGGDGAGAYNHAAIIDRLWGGVDQSELLIYKGNDPDTATIHDRVRIAAAGRIVFHSINAYADVDAYISGNTGNINGSGYFNGNDLIVTGNVTAYSDITLKENIEVIQNAVSKVKQIDGVTYTRNDLSDKTRRYAGVIAQQVEKVLPEVVEQDEDGLRNVAYGNMVGLLIEAIKEQQSEIDELKALVKQLLAK